MRVFMVSLAFVPARVAIEAMKQIYATVGDIEFTHHVLMQHFPRDKARNDLLLETLFKSYNCKIHDLGKNIGLAAGYTYLINQLGLKEGDIVIGADLDVNPVTPKWLNAIVDVFKADPTVGYVSLQNQHSAREMQDRGFTVHTIGGHICHEGHTPVVQSIIGWSAKTLFDLGGIQEQRVYYGGSEVTMWPKLKALGLKWVYLPQYEEKFHPFMQADRCYVEYKWAYAHLRNTDLDFESWLKEDPSRDRFE